jgi:hypothetical protein
MPVFVANGAVITVGGAPVRAAAAGSSVEAVLDEWLIDTAIDEDFTQYFTIVEEGGSYTISGLPTGMSDDGDGTASGTPTGTPSSGVVTVTYTEPSGNELVGEFEYVTAYRAIATAGASLTLVFPEDSAIASTNLAQNFTENGNTITYLLVDTPPTGLSASGATLSGTPTTVTAPANYTFRATDEYSRVVEVEHSIEVTSTTNVLTLVSDTLDQDPAGYEFDLDTAGTVTWDFNSTDTDPGSGNGDIDTGTESAVSGLNEFTVDLPPSETGYLFFRAGSSNVLVSQQFTTPGVDPDAFVIDDWSLAQGSNPNELDVTISSLPTDNGDTITDIEHRRRLVGDTFSGWTSSGGTTSFTITANTAGNDYEVQIRAVNGNGGVSADSDTKTATSGAAGASSGYIADGVTGVNGTATAATYNTSTGVGEVHRNSGSANQSWVRFSGLPTGAGAVTIEIEATSANGIRLLNLSDGGFIENISSAGTIGPKTITVSTGELYIVANADGQSCPFTITTLEDT